MKTTRPHLLIALMIAFLTLLSFASVYPAAAQNKRTISKKELKVLLRTATEPAEHQKIAEYYRQEAQRLTTSSKEHQELAAIYGKNPPFPAMESKHGDSFGQGASHCRKFAELQAEAAKEAEALATLHEGMAKAAEQKQQ
jgi:hypothetical protein